MIYVADLIQHTAVELLNIDGIGRKTFYEIETALAEMGLELGTFLPDWPPNDIEEQLDPSRAARRAAELQQTKGGATFEALVDRLSMVSIGDDNDLEAAMRPINVQMHSAVIEKREISSLLLPVWIIRSVGEV